MNFNYVTSVEFLRDLTALWMLLTMPMAWYIIFIEKNSSRLTKYIYILMGLFHALFSIYLTLTQGLYEEITPAIIIFCWGLFYTYFSVYHELFYNQANQGQE